MFLWFYFFLSVVAPRAIHHIRSGSGSRHPSMSACPDIIPAQLINNIIPSAAALLKGMTSSHEGSSKNINIYGPGRELKAKLTALASLKTLCPAMIHHASRKTDTISTRSAIITADYRALVFFVCACVLYLPHATLQGHDKAGSTPYDATFGCRWLEHLHHHRPLFLPVSFSILQTFNES